MIACEHSIKITKFIFAKYFFFRGERKGKRERKMLTKVLFWNNIKSGLGIWITDL